MKPSMFETHRLAFHDSARFLLTVVPQFIGLFFMQMGLILTNGVIPTELKPKHNISQAHPTGLNTLLLVDC